MNPSITPAFIDQYCKFVASPLQTRDEAIQDLATLLTLPMVSHIAFADSNIPTLMIGTNEVSIANPSSGVRHYIGEFVIQIHRQRVERYWEADFFLTNISFVSPSGEVGFQGKYMHPHMLVNSNIDCELITHNRLPIAHICISKGRFHIFQAIRRGRIALATDLIINLLHSLGPNSPFYDIGNWPTRSATATTRRTTNDR